jgi:hypothetical protein
MLGEMDSAVPEEDPTERGRSDRSNTHVTCFGNHLVHDAHLIGAGREDDVADLTFVIDPNGLPSLPDELTGVLRALYTEAHGDAEAAELFGFQKRDEERDRARRLLGMPLRQREPPREGIVDAARLADRCCGKPGRPTCGITKRITPGAADAVANAV